ncbi:MAG: glycosyltransferase family 2 protein [Deltaproteobacteria bacterium]|nr:glycosyltransferase family 2 protein [Deltaproteobacteria bacterium]MBW2395967.1 glycosyltransferase family 2 protein [Deltaproteobacteria bacterium]
MKLLCVTVNYRTADLTLGLLQALEGALAGLDATVTVVENGSDDDSEARLRKGIAALPGEVPVHLLCSRENLGFGGGNNLAIRAALADAEPPDVIHLINPDAVPERGALKAMLAFLEAHPEAGIAGSAVIDDTGEFHCSAFRFPSPLGDLEGRLRLGLASRLLERWRIPLEPGGEAREVDWVSGSTCSLRRTMLEKVGLFDEAFFLYFEETDLCQRAKAAGFQVWTVPTSIVHHTGAVTTGLDDLTRRRPAFWFESRRLYLRKHHGRTGLWLADLSWLLGSFLFGLRRGLAGRPKVDPPGLVTDFVRHGLGLPLRTDSGS